MNKTIIPPIKCQGIKTKLVHWIKDQNIDLNNKIWIEPFMGSGVVGFNIKPENAIFSDSNPHIVNFYNAINKNKLTPQIARDFLEFEGALLKENGVEHYYLVRERFNAKSEPLDFLFLNRSCFNGLMRFNRKGGYNVPFCHKPERFAKAYVTKIVNQVKNVQLLCNENNWEFKHQPFNKTLNNCKENAFIYCDPPYIDRHSDYFNGWNKTDEELLFKLL